MFTFAIVMILAGLLLIGYLILSISMQKERAGEEAEHRFTHTPQNGKTERTDSPTPIERVAPQNIPSRESDPQPVPVSYPSPMNQNSSPPPFRQKPGNRRRTTVHISPPPGERSTVRLRKIDQAALQSTLELMQGEKKGVPEEQLIVKGVLFLDLDRYVPARVGSFDRSPPRQFNNLKREGGATLVLEGATFRILCGNATYAFSSAELEQILFLQDGIALVPLAPNRPIPVFLTPDFERVKEWVGNKSQVK